MNVPDATESCNDHSYDHNYDHGYDHSYDHDDDDYDYDLCLNEPPKFGRIMSHTRNRKTVESSIVETSITLPCDVVRDLTLTTSRRRGVSSMIQNIVGQKFPEMEQWVKTPITGAWPVFLEYVHAKTEIATITVRFSSNEIDVLDRFAARYTGGNRSQLICRILMEAIRND